MSFQIQSTEDFLMLKPIWRERPIQREYREGDRSGFWFSIIRFRFGGGLIYCLEASIPSTTVSQVTILQVWDSRMQDLNTKFESLQKLQIPCISQEWILGAISNMDSELNLDQVPEITPITDIPMTDIISPITVVADDGIQNMLTNIILSDAP